MNLTNHEKWKNHHPIDILKKIFTVVLLVLLLCGTFLIRVQGTPHIPEGQFTSNDGYFYYWQAGLISEHGKLPGRDMHRWLPLGRDLGQTLNLYGYILAYTHKAVASVFPDITLYHVTFYTPTVCFCIGLGVLCIFLSNTYGLLFSSMVGMFLATLPGAMLRSVGGFGDRDSWCFLLGVFVVTTYLVSLQTQSPRSRLLWTIASGFTVFLGGISWEGFGVFLSIILCVEVWKFLTTEQEEELLLYLLWVCTFVPTLYLVSPAYRNGYGFAQHLFAFMLVPPLVLLGIRTLRYLLLSKVEKLQPYARTLALGLTLASIALALGYVLIQRHTFADTTVPFSQTTLMQSVGELKETSIRSWKFHYGSVFILGGLGAVIAVLRLWRKQGMVFAAPLAFFVVTAFYGSILDTLWGLTASNGLFGVAIASCIIGGVVLAWHQQHTDFYNLTYIAFIMWFLFWAALARNSNRYDFFLGMSIAFFTADIIRYLANFYGNQVKKRLPQLLLKTFIILMMLTLILFWDPVGGHAKRALYAAPKIRIAIPGRGSVADTFYWMKDNLPRTAVVAANWSNGSQLNVLAGVKSILDQDHYIPHWIHLYNQHIYAAASEQEALEFLKSHNATHFMFLHGMESSDSFLHKGPSEAFIPVYPTEKFTDAKIKVWEIHYPSDIQPNPKYLKTGFPEIDRKLPLQ